MIRLSDDGLPTTVRRVGPWMSRRLGSFGLRSGVPVPVCGCSSIQSHMTVPACTDSPSMLTKTALVVVEDWESGSRIDGSEHVCLQPLHVGVRVVAGLGEERPVERGQRSLVE